MALPPDPVEQRGKSAVDGTPAALGPIAREVLAWVARQRTLLPSVRPEAADAHADHLRRIELCALATLDISMLASLYAVLPKEGTGPCASHSCPCS